MTQLATLSESLAATPSVAFSIPLADLTEFSGLKEARRVEVRFFLGLLERVHALRGPGNLMKAVATIAAQHKHQMRGCSKGTLYRKYCAYLGSVSDEHPTGDWRTLLNGYQGPKKLPEAFRKEVRRLSQLNHNSIAEALQQLRERWAAGEPIPGYGRDGVSPGTWIEYHARRHPDKDLPKAWPRGFFPPGWSVRNLYRCASNKGARTLFQRGVAAAKKHFPSAVRDTSQLRPMEWIVIDDFQLDSMCFFPGDAKNPPQIAPVAGLLAMCVGTRRKLHWGLGAMLTREERQKDGSVKQVRCGIRRVDVQVLIHDILAKYGLPDYPITILCENATAAIAPELELALSTLFEGRVRVKRTGLIEHRNLTNGFLERGGKPWEKGWVESLFHKLWNILGAAPGYKGSNSRLNAPGDLDDKIAYTRLLIGQGERQLNLPPEALAQLRLPFPSPEVLERAFAWACHLTDTRTTHKFIGFDRVTEFLLEDGGEPQPFSALALLSPEQQLAVRPVERMQSPLERWDRLAAQTTWTPLPASVLALLLLTPKRVTYRNHSVTFVHDRQGYTYTDPKGEVLRDRRDGEELLGYLDLAAPEHLHLADLGGSYLGTIKRLGGRRGMVDILDREAGAEVAADQATLLNRVVAENRELHADLDAQLAADRAHNTAIVEAHRAATAGLSKAERIAAGADAAKARMAHAKAAQQADADLAAEAKAALRKRHYKPAPTEPLSS